METKILDSFPHWPGYIALAVFVFFLVACIWACAIHILAAFVVPRVPYKRLPGYFSTLFLTVCAMTVCWLLCSMMFIRFNAVAIAPDHIELLYYWPRPSLVIQASSLRRADVVHYRRRGGHLEISTDQHVFTSIDVRKFTTADEIQVGVQTLVSKSK